MISPNHRQPKLQQCPRPPPRSESRRYKYRTGTPVHPCSRSILTATRTARDRPVHIANTPRSAGHSQPAAPGSPAKRAEGAVSSQAHTAHVTLPDRLIRDFPELPARAGAAPTG